MKASTYDLLETLSRTGRDVMQNVLLVWAVSAMLIISKNHMDDVAREKIESEKKAEIARKVAELEAETFDDYMQYYRIFSQNETVEHRSRAYLTSDAEVKKAGFTITWREKLECDNNPYDSATTFEHYASVQTTSAKQGVVRPRPVNGGKGMKGWPLREWRDPSVDSKYQPPVIRYPDHDADCRLRSHMTQSHVDAAGKIHKKTKTMFSDVIKVRGYGF